VVIGLDFLGASGDSRRMIPSLSGSRLSPVQRFPVLSLSSRCPSLLATLLLLLFLEPAGQASEPLPRLQVSGNGRFLVTEQGKPFFWLGDTAWELFHRLNREEAEIYLSNRAALGFNVIHAVALAELDGLNTPNPYGHRPLRDLDPTRPNEEYFRHVDWIVRRANALGMYVGFLPTWGDKWNKAWGVGPEIFTPANAEAYGEWLGRRYRDAGVVWILGGDRPIDAARADGQRAILRAMLRGLRNGDGGKHLVTFHPTGGAGSVEVLGDEPGIDFHMRQNGHNAEYTGRYDKTWVDYGRSPAKPVIDGEPLYEDHPVGFDAKKFGHSIAGDVRRPLYWDLFGGAFGHTYGHHSVWQMWAPGRDPVNNPLMPWTEAILQPGAAQMRHGRALIESRPSLSRIPDDGIVVLDRVPTSVPGAGRYRFVATRDVEGTYAMVYAPVGRSFRVRMDVIRGPKVRAWWFNPRDGSAQRIGRQSFANTGEREFVPPSPGEMLDWVLVLDDAAKGYPRPGGVWKREERDRTRR